MSFNIWLGRHQVLPQPVPIRLIGSPVCGCGCLIQSYGRSKRPPRAFIRHSLQVATQYDIAAGAGIGDCGTEFRTGAMDLRDHATNVWSRTV
jgi:hypothetical protein